MFSEKLIRSRATVAGVMNRAPVAEGACARPFPGPWLDVGPWLSMGPWLNMARLFGSRRD